ncbi:MAG: transcriptional repressor [Candidatus Magasanikbacteria bacterium]|nr:transcriptional repressor [Candidatus Magasanikbacteria bacterium]
MKCEEHYEQSAAILKKGKLKSTGARLKLMDILKHAKKPLSVSDIFVLLKDKKADKVTLYRNVEALAELGVLKQIRLKDRQAYYELVEKNHHHHIICSSCGKIKDISKCAVQIINNSFLSSVGFAKLTEHSLEFFGVCSVCAKK